ncbi:MAG TPA: type IV pilus twitching motility protein PilT, partial [Rhodothermales bacterium]|nr:type IV pilus twitching motility protein PilT [Rhodothermales bacterium]
MYPQATAPSAPPTAQDEQRLPPSYYRIVEETSSEYVGMDRMRVYAEQLNALPQADRDAARALFAEYAEKMVERNASDLDLGGPGCNELIWYRVDGFKRPEHEMGRLSMEEANMLLLTMLAPYQQQYLFQHYAHDFGYSLEVPGDMARRFRASVYMDQKQLGLSMRMLPWKPRPLRSLGFHPRIEHGFMFRFVRDGLTLFTGVTGSGKSTTLDAIVDANNDDFEGHILIIAQPIEYIHTSKKCIVRHREVGTDVDNFVEGMIQGLRQDPDIVVVGEMRNPETIEAAMEMADTGHKVFSTLHTGSAMETIDRIVAEYSPDEQERIRHRLADVLRCVVSQKLLPAVSGGRILAKEVLWMTSSSRAAIKNNNTHEIYQMMWEGSDEGMITLEQDLLRLLHTGDITPDTALAYANN